MIASFGLALLAGVCVLCLASRAEAAAKKAPVFSEIPGVTTPLVGRGEEVGLLLDAFRRCRSERAMQLVTLVGVPGIGKSRLVWELMQATDPSRTVATHAMRRAVSSCTIPGTSWCPA